MNSGKTLLESKKSQNRNSAAACRLLQRFIEGITSFWLFFGDCNSTIQHSIPSFGYVLFVSSRFSHLCEICVQLFWSNWLFSCVVLIFIAMQSKSFDDREEMRARRRLESVRKGKLLSVSCVKV